MIFNNTAQIITEIKKAFLDAGITQREVCARLNISPQLLNKTLNKKNFSFEDAARILSAAGYDLKIEFVKVPEKSPEE